MLEARKRQKRKIENRLEISDDDDRKEIEIKGFQKYYSLTLTFSSYDGISSQFDYPIESSFVSFYNPTMQLVTSFPN